MYLLRLKIINRHIDSSSVETPCNIIRTLKQKCRLLERINTIYFSKYEDILHEHSKLILLETRMLIELIGEYDELGVIPN